MLLCVAVAAELDVPVCVADWVPLEVAVRDLVRLCEGDTAWLRVKLGVTLGVGVTVSTVDAVNDGVSDVVMLRVCDVLRVGPWLPERVRDADCVCEAVLADEDVIVMEVVRPWLAVKVWEDDIDCVGDSLMLGVTA